MPKLNNFILDVTHDDTLETLIHQLFEAPLHSQHSTRVMDSILTKLGEQLQCDRVFLYLRSPDTQLGRVPFCWKKQPSIPTIYDPAWKPEDPSLAKDDPMFAAALKAQPSIFVEDVETAGPEVLNREFEHQTFGHRALIHAHLRSDQTLWGILQACVFEEPRVWSQSDRQLIEQVVTQLTPFAIDYVRSEPELATSM
ncbi:MULTISPECIES: GAF domain-containing protein [Cyanophyceae]|uniref:GAF domain-containing protein n=1 Tax=Leptolyngbya subtilissima DQ-A4 TaxID=2933933 RepID=A0ABV0K4L8_9CYAN|nr:GAF domain-containing protein [Nodosilinea sp. FACHB-141]MBD2112663.1 GAF domain-containing protein [Nodosilinea sp. FACHB-141]